MRWVPFVFVIAASTALAACDYATVSVHNQTNEPIFVNPLSEDSQSLKDDRGVLVQPGETVKDTAIGARARNLRGETVFYQWEFSDGGHDSSYDIQSLSPDRTAPPYDVLGGVTGESTYVRTICEAGKRRDAYFFGMVVTTANQTNQPVVVQIYERYADGESESAPRGELVLPLSAGEVWNIVFRQPWLRVFAGDGTIVYTAPLQLAAQQQVTIPERLPTTVAEIPAQDFERGTGLTSGCWLSYTLRVGEIVGPLVLMMFILVTILAILVGIIIAITHLIRSVTNRRS